MSKLTFSFAFAVIFFTWCVHIKSFHKFPSITKSIRNKNIYAKKISEEEWNQIKQSIEENKEAWQLALNAKRQQFKSLKSSNVLSKLTEESLQDEEQVDEVDELLGVKKSNTEVKDSDEIDDTTVDEDDNEVDDNDDYDISEILISPPGKRKTKDSVIAVGTLKYLQSKYESLI